MPLLPLLLPQQPQEQNQPQPQQLLSSHKKLQQDQLQVEQTDIQLMPPMLSLRASAIAGASQADGA